MDLWHKKTTVARIAATVFALGCASGAIAQSADREGRFCVPGRQHDPRGGPEIRGFRPGVGYRSGYGDTYFLRA